MAATSKTAETSSPAAPGASVCKFTPEQVTFKACNFKALLNIPDDKPQFKEGATFIKVCPLMYAFVHNPVGITSHLQALWHTAECTTITTDKGNVFPAIGFEIPVYGYFAFTAGFLRHSLRLPARGKNQRWEDEPTKEQIADFLDAIGYAWDNPANKSVGSKMEKKKLNARWQYIFTQVIQCLSSKIGSHDQASKHLQDIGFSLCTGYRLDYADYIFADMFSRVKAEKRDKTKAVDGSSSNCC